MAASTAVLSEIACPPDGAGEAEVHRWVEAHHAAVIQAEQVDLDWLHDQLLDGIQGREVEMATVVVHHPFSGSVESDGVFAYESYTGPLAWLVGEDAPRRGFECWLLNAQTGQPINGTRELCVPVAASYDAATMTLAVACGHASRTVYVRAV